MVQEATVIVPLKLYTKEKQIEFEEKLLKYIKLFAHEEYKLDILIKKTFDDDLRVQTSDLVKLFKSYQYNKFFVKALQDRLLNLINTNMESLSIN